MRLSDRESWHHFVYETLYPAVLGALLYETLDFLGALFFEVVHAHSVAAFDLARLTRLSIVTLFVIDCLHVYADWPRRSRKFLDTFSYGAVAIFLGIAYLQVSDKHLRFA